MSRAPVEVAVFVHRETDGALLVSELGRVAAGGEVEGGVFLPWSEISWPPGELEKLRRWQARAAGAARGGARPGGLFGGVEPLPVTLQVPEWLAMDRGLI